MQEIRVPACVMKGVSDHVWHADDDHTVAKYRVMAV